jgi:hypothetical protein
MLCGSGSIVTDLCLILAHYEGAGCVVAPAGFGKTHLIASSVAHATRRQLVLTHTYAGVNALRRKMRECQVSSALYQIDTIASWALRLCLSYIKSCGWTIERPEDAQWDQLYASCSSLLEKGFIRQIVEASYGGLYVDEYQDCSSPQSQIVLKLAKDLPCRVLGDPLQAIFDFEGQNVVDWSRDVAPNFKELGKLDIPHRWNLAGAPQLGEWLRVIRQKLEDGEAIDLREAPRDGVRIVIANDTQKMFLSQAKVCRYFRCDPQHSVIAIHKGSPEYKLKCHALAKSVGGRFSSIEEIEGKALFSFIRTVTAAKAHKTKLKAVIEFAKKCMTSIVDSLSEASKRGEMVTIRANTKHPEIAVAANRYLERAGGAEMLALFSALRAANDVNLVRGDLFHRLLGVLRKQIGDPKISLLEAAEKYHSEFRHKGRPVGHRKLIGTTLLVKGLEFQHAIVLDAASLTRKELYVALTRGANSITIVSSSAVLNPAA